MFQVSNYTTIYGAGLPSGVISPTKSGAFLLVSVVQGLQAVAHCAVFLQTPDPGFTGSS